MLKCTDARSSQRGIIEKKSMFLYLLWFYISESRKTRLTTCFGYLIGIDVLCYVALFLPRNENEKKKRKKKRKRRKRKGKRKGKEKEKKRKGKGKRKWKRIKKEEKERKTKNSPKTRSRDPLTQQRLEVSTRPVSLGMQKALRSKRALTSHREMHIISTSSGMSASSNKTRASLSFSCWIYCTYWIELTNNPNTEMASSLPFQ